MSKIEVERIVDNYIATNININFDGNSSLSISEIGQGGCACSLLTDNADWDSPTWDIQPEFLPNLARTLSFIYKGLPNGYIFKALWAGDKIERSLDVTQKDLLEDVLSNQIKTKTSYLVKTLS